MSAQEEFVSVVDANPQPSRAEASRWGLAEENQASGRPEKGAQHPDERPPRRGVGRGRTCPGEAVGWGGELGRACQPGRPVSEEGLGRVRQGGRGLAMSDVGLEEREASGRAWVTS